MRKKITAECPICQKQWEVPSEEDAYDLEATLAQAAMYGALFEEGQTVWLYGTKECTVEEIRLERCAYYKNAQRYAHPLKYLLRRVSDGARYEVIWQQVLPQPLHEIKTVKKGIRTYWVTWRNYWKFFTEMVGFH